MEVAVGCAVFAGRRHGCTAARPGGADLPLLRSRDDLRLYAEALVEALLQRKGRDGPRGAHDFADEIACRAICRLLCVLLARLALALERLALVVLLPAELLGDHYHRDEGRHDRDHRQEELPGAVDGEECDGDCNRRNRAHLTRAGGGARCEQ